MITLYDCATAPSPRRARILLAEKGVPHETVQVDLRTGEQLGEAYRLVDHAQIPALAERGLLRVNQFFGVLNERLATREFIATERFSLVDITAVVAVDFARVVKVRVTEAHPHLLRWREAMAQRPSMSI